MGLILTIGLSISVLLAEDPLVLDSKSSVLPGMAYHDVLKIWGAPQEKTVQEVKRIDVWRYDEQLVYFKQGKVFKTTELTTNAGVSAQALAEPVPSIAKPKSNQPDDAQMEKILNEIIGTGSK